MKKEINLEDLNSEKPEIKYCCAKQAILLSRENPEALYNDFDVFTKLLDSEKNVLKWTALQVLGNLSFVDSKNKIDKLVPRLISFLDSRELITASNAILGLTEIAKNKPKYKNRILKEFLKTDKHVYYNKGEISPECKNIVLGHVIEALENFTEDIKSKTIFTDFLKRQQKNTRASVAKKAKILLEKLK